MRKFFMIGMALTVSLAMLLTSCKKEEVNNNGNNNDNTENPGGGSSGSNYNNQEYPFTANVIRRAVTDIDGNIYDAVQLGNQVWMAENLRTTRYADGTIIPLIATECDPSESEPERYYPNNNEHTVNHYGYLYNWSAVMHSASGSVANPSGVQGICPNGWHVPSPSEFMQLFDYLKTQPEYMASGNSDHIAKALAAIWGWESCNYLDAPGINPTTNNASGFSALPAGINQGANAYHCFGEEASFSSASGACFDIFHSEPYIEYASGGIDWPFRPLRPRLERAVHSLSRQARFSFGARVLRAARGGGCYYAHPRLRP